MKYSENMPDGASRRFPPTWDVEDNGSCFIVRDANGQALSYVYYENEGGRRTAASLLTHDEARRIAANIARPTKSTPRRADRRTICAATATRQPKQLRWQISPQGHQRATDQQRPYGR